MKNLFILVVVTTLLSSFLSAEQTPAPAKQLPVPQFTQIDIFENHMLLLKWDPVKVDEENPILGYKIFVWEERQKQVSIYDGVTQQKLLVSFQPNANMEIPSSEPVTQLVVTPDSTEVILGLKQQMWYQIRLHAFTAHEKGPFSPPTVIMLGNDIPIRTDSNARMTTNPPK